MDAIAEREGFIVAYPLGSPSVSTGLFGHTWNGFLSFHSFFFFFLLNEF